MQPRVRDPELGVPLVQAETRDQVTSSAAAHMPQPGAIPVHVKSSQLVHDPFSAYTHSDDNIFAQVVLFGGPEHAQTPVTTSFSSTESLFSVSSSTQLLNERPSHKQRKFKLRLVSCYKNYLL